MMKTKTRRAHGCCSEAGGVRTILPGFPVSATKHPIKEPGSRRGKHLTVLRFLVNLEVISSRSDETVHLLYSKTISSNNSGPDC